MSAANDEPPKPRANKEQRRERVEFCALMLRNPVQADGSILTPHRMARACGQKFGVSVRQGWTYLKRAQDLLERRETPTQRLRGDWVSRCLESMIADKDEETKEKLSAISLYMKRNGLEAANKNANTNAAGEDIPPTRSPAEDRAEFIDLLKKVKPAEGA